MKYLIITLCICFFTFGESSIIPLLNYPLSNNPNDIKFYFYPLNGNPVTRKEIIYNDASSLAASAFNPNAPMTVVMVHGFTDNSTVHLNAVLLPAYLSSGLPYNFIVVDWGLLSGNAPFSTEVEMALVYGVVVSQSIPIVVTRTVQFLQFLGVPESKLHVIGHSLGAHVSGNAGSKYFLSTGNKVGRITGLDPAGPLFTTSFPFPKINKTDAEFVDIIHTNMGAFGDVSADGHVDFIVNGGVSQPACGLNNHQFAPIVYAASLQNNFPSCPCGALSLVTGTLLGIDQGDENCDVKVNMGESAPATARGLYCLTTASTP